MKAVLIEVGRAEVTVSHAGDSEWRVALAYDSAEALERALASLSSLPGWPRGVRRARIKLGRDVSQRRTLVGLPPVKLPVLQELVAAEQTRFFRRRSGPLLTSARWLPGRKSEPVRAEAVAAEGSLVEALCRGLEAQGIRAGPVVIEQSALMLEGATQSQRHRARVRRSLRALCLGNVLAWSAAGITHVHALRTLDQQLAQEVQALSEPARALTAARRELATVAATVATIDEAGARRHAIHGYLAALALALPDSAFMTSVSLAEGGGVRLTGVARSASATQAALARALRAPVRLDGEPVPEPGDRGWERFALSMERRVR